MRTVHKCARAGVCTVLARSLPHIVYDYYLTRYYCVFVSNDHYHQYYFHHMHDTIMQVTRAQLWETIITVSMLGLTVKKLKV